MEKRDKTFPIKSPKQIDCSSCKFSCSANFTEELRMKICNSFWLLGDYRRQKDFILMNVKSNEPKRRRPSTKRDPLSDPKIRTNAKSFFLLNQRVCQSFFLKTLAISNGPLIKAFAHKNIYTNFFDGDDRRGRHEPANKLGKDVVKSVTTFIEQFTTQGSKTKRQTITSPEIKSLRHLYGLFKEVNPDTLSYTSFKRIFNEHNFVMPSDRHAPRAKAEIKQEVEVEALEEIEVDTDDQNEFSDALNATEEIVDEESPVQTPPEMLPQQNMLVAQVPDNANFFANPSQIYEIQIIEVCMPPVLEPS